VKAALYLCDTVPTAPGYYLIGEDGEGHAIIHAAPHSAAPEGSTLVVDGAVTPWSWTDLSTIAPEIADYCIQATWANGTDEDGEPVIVRGARVHAAGELLTDGLPPHFWFGDEQ